MKSNLGGEVQVQILETMTVNELIRRFPVTVAVFNRYGIDTCCGGAEAIRAAADRAGADAAAMLTDLRRVMGEET